MRYQAFAFRIALLFSGLLALQASFPVRCLAQQNVVLVILDALREDAVDASRGGVPLMPYLSSFSSARFRHAYSTAPWTTASMTSIFTGVHVDTHQIHDGVSALPLEAETMAEYFKQAGYATLGVQTNGNVTDTQGLTQGFDEYAYTYDMPANWVTGTALSMTSGVVGPFFLYVHYMEPHVPYDPPPDYRIQMGYPNPGLTPAERGIVEDFLPYQVDYLRYHLGLQPALTFPQLSALGQDAARSLYDGEVRFNDDQLGLLLDGLLAAHPDSIIIVTADHGEHFWEHNSLGHTTTVYEPLVHVPLFLRAPGLPSASHDTIVSLVDLFPTLASLTGLPSRPHWEGRNLFGLRDALGPVYSCGKCRAPWLRDLETIRLGDLKLIREYKTGHTELYDIAADPGEFINFNTIEADTADAMTRLLHMHLLENARANGPDSAMTVFPDELPQEGTMIRLAGPEGTGHVWFRNGVPLDAEDPRISGAEAQILEIVDLSPDDAGNYECMYSDALLHLNVTHAHALEVAPAAKVPALSPCMAALLACTLAALAVRAHVWNKRPLC